MQQTNMTSSAAIVLLTLPGKEFHQKRGTTPQELRIKILAEKMGLKIIEFFADAESGYRFNWPQRKTACDLLMFIEQNKLQGCTLILDQPTRLQNAIHPYLFKGIQTVCKIVSLDEIYSEGSREGYE